MLITVITHDHPVLDYGDICRVLREHETHLEVIRGEDNRHTAIAKDKTRKLEDDY